ncbi:MAG: transposase [Clostridia bacterium]|nr:transposase [Clostridia bacterium]
MDSYPKRKRLRLYGYDYSMYGLYFITICTFEKQCILGSIPVGADAHIGPQIKLTSYGEIVKKHLLNIKTLDQFCIMPNHIHMILSLSDDGPMWASAPTKVQSVSQIVRSFKTLCTKEIGHSIFQRSFYDHIIRTEKEYYKISQYIYNNPAQWEADQLYQNDPT